MARGRQYIQNYNMDQDLSGALWPPLRELVIDTVATSFESPDSTYGPFLLNRFALTWIVEGGGVTSLDERSIATSPGTVLSMVPGTFLRHNWGRKKSLQTFIVFDPGKLPSAWPRPSSWIVERRLSGTEPFLELFRFVVARHHAGVNPAGLLERSVELLLRMFLTGEVEGKARLSSEFSRPVERALDHLVKVTQSKHPRVTLGELSRVARVSETHLCRVFQKELGQSPIACAELLRVERAASRLERTELSLSEVAAELGYSSAFHLSKNFKDAYGISPRDYRKAFRSGLATRPPGIVFRNHRLRNYLYERGAGRILLPESPPGAS